MSWSAPQSNVIKLMVSTLKREIDNDAHAHEREKERERGWGKMEGGRRDRKLQTLG